MSENAGPDGRQTGILAEMTRDDVEELDPEVVLFGVASTEPHGPHLPYGTDVYQTEGVCRRAVTSANERGARALMYPTLPIGNNVNFKAYPFACRIGVRTLMDVVLDVIEAIEEEGVRKVVVVNGHGGNTATLQATLREHAGRNDPDEGAFVCLTSTFDAIDDEAAARIEHPSQHGGESETSRMLYLRPDLVREEEFDAFDIQNPTVDELAAEDVSFVPPWHGYMPESAGGETRASSAEKGEALVESAAEFVADVLVALDETETHELFPYPEN
jgi:creatinine amidohydrolase